MVSLLARGLVPMLWHPVLIYTVGEPVCVVGRAPGVEAVRQDLGEWAVVTGPGSLWRLLTSPLPLALSAEIRYT